MSDRRPETKLYEPCDHGLKHPHHVAHYGCDGSDCDRVCLGVQEVDPVAVVRRGVESGTIKGTEIGVFPTFEGDHVIEIPGQRKKRLADELEPGTYLVIPVSDGGSET